MGCEPTEGMGPATCAQCMEYGQEAARQCVFSGCTWRNFEQDCVEGRDRLKVATGMWMVAAGWLMMVWVGGWARRNCGKLQTLRRSGRRLKAEVVTKRQEQRMVVSGGWPVKANVFTVRIRYQSEAGQAKWTVRDVNVARANYETLQDGESIEVVVDKSDERVVFASSVVDADRERFGWVVLSIAGATIVPGLLIGGIAMMLDAYHCWSSPSCCDDADPNNHSDTPCDGVGGRSHWALCDAPCEQGWMTWMMMSSMFGLMLAFMIVLLRSGSGLSSSADEEPGCSWTKAGNFCFGTGQFCSEEDPNFVVLEVIRPQRPSSSADSSENSHVPDLNRGVMMLDRTFRGVTGGARHYEEQPLTEEEAYEVEEELQQQEKRRQQEAQSEEEIRGDEVQQLVDKDTLHDDDAPQERDGWEYEEQQRAGRQQVTWADDYEASSVDTEARGPDGSAGDFVAPLPTYQA